MSSTDAVARVSPLHLHAFNRATLVWEDGGWAYPVIDGERVTVSDYEAFLREWSRWYDAQQKNLSHSCSAFCIFATAAEMVALGARIPGFDPATSQRVSSSQRLRSTTKN